MTCFPAQDAFGMKWLRSNVRHGSRLALFALVLQLALSFGHFHGVAAQEAPAIQSGPMLSDAVAGPVGQPASDHDSDQQGEVCALCAIIALANSVLFAAPPVLLLPQATEFLYLTVNAGFIHLNSVRVAFQPRAPPIS
jgi:hypothetical protein